MGRFARFLPVLAAVAVPFAGAAHPPQVVVKEEGHPNALVLLDETGGGTVELTRGKPAPSWNNGISWSPDGSRLVYVSGSFSSGDLYILDVDGGSVTRLTTGGRNRDPTWSPDGSRIAYLHSARVKPGSYAVNDELWLVAPDGRDARRVVRRTSGGETYGLAWSPDGTRILYLGPSLVVVDAGTGRVLLQTDDGGGSWSPDGSQIAVSSAHKIDVINADGTGRHTVAGAGPAGRYTDDLSPVWSPDGTRIVFTRSLCGPTPRSGCIPDLSTVYVVGADGRGERRLTGPISGGPGSMEAGFPNDNSAGASWWPDGSQLFFFTRHSSLLYVMNDDGTCQHPFRADLQIGAAMWRPGAKPTVPPLRCIDLSVRVTPNRDPVGLRGDARVLVTIENDGNESATGVKLTLRLTDGLGRTLPPAAGRGRILPPLPSCRGTSVLECDGDPLAAGRSTKIAVAVAGQKPSFFGLEASVAAAETDSDPASNKSFTGVGVLNCDIVGTAGADLLVGTPGRDRICGLAGPDVIRAGAGNDWIEGGSGGDTIYPGPGRDVVVSWGPDRIYARDGERDVIDCGGSVRGVVYVDRIDKVTDCGKKIVRRP